MPKDSPSPRYRHRPIRFAPDSGTYAKIDLELDRSDGSFNPTILALVPEESTKGVGVFILTSEHFQVGTKCRIQVGRLSPLRAEVRWRQEITPGLLRLGLLYLE